MYDPGTAEAWKSDIAGQTKKLHHMQLEGPIKVSLFFLMERPKSHFKTDGKSLKPIASKRYFTKKPDADNLAKAVLDALTAMGVWKDDSQVVILDVTKAWADVVSRAGCILTILTIDENED
jgi:Holliday junction resolvase RusA-like endonuclease